MSQKDINKEYSRLRAIANKRLERFQGTEWETSQIYKYNKRGFAPIKELTEREIRFMLSDVARFVTSKRSSVSGLNKERAQAVETLKERGFDFVNKKNFRQFGEFMEYARMSNLNRIYDSKRVAEFYEQAEKKNKTVREMRDAFNEWKDKQKPQNKIQNKSKKDSNKFRRSLE